MKHYKKELRKARNDKKMIEKVRISLRNELFGTLSKIISLRGEFFPTLSEKTRT